MKEKIRLISRVCDNTVMGTDKLTTRRLSASIRKTDARELFLYRLPVWCSMGDDGSPGTAPGTQSIRYLRKRIRLWGSGRLKYGASRESYWVRWLVQRENRGI